MLTRALLALLILVPTSVFALEVQLKDHLGSPTIMVNGKPTSPLVFFGWAGGSGRPTPARIDPQWQEYSVTFEAPENDTGAGIHFRLGGDGPGTVWVDNVRLYPGRKVGAPQNNMVRNGDFEITRDAFAKDWSWFHADYAKVDADWTLDDTTAVTGKQSLRVNIRNAGENTMHLHFWQVGYTLKKGQTYTYSLWMKSDKPRNVDFMCLHIDEPWTIYSGATSAYVQQVQLAAAAGVHIHSFGIDMPWPEPGKQPDFSGVDRMLQQTIDTDPQALCIPRFGMEPPESWLQAHPGHRELFDDGKTEGVCVASEPWRAEMQVHLRALVRHCEDKWGDRIIAYHPCGQHTGEWFYCRSWEPRLSDFAPAMSEGFARWVKAKYPTLAALRAAWDDPTITFEAVKTPTKEELLNTSLGFFRDPTRERKVIDWFVYKNLAMEEPLEMMARVIKDETKRKKLTCFFYGYLFDMHGVPMGPQGTGHLAMAKMARCPDVDILCSPISYNDREQGGAGVFMSAVDSVRAHGKLWLNEDDTRTYVTPKDESFGRVETAEGTHWVHERNFAELYPRRLATWYMDLGGVGWLNAKDIWDNIGLMQRFYQQHLDTPAKWKPEIALIVDEDSAAYTKCSSALHSPLVYQMRSAFYRIGAPVGIYMLSDLVAGKVPPAKVYYFLNCFHLDAAQRAAVKQATQAKVATWFYGGGYISDRAGDANMAEVIGLNLTSASPPAILPPGGEARGAGVSPARRAQPGTVTVVPSNLSTGLGATFGVETPLDPCWSISEPGAEVIARFGDGTVAAAAKTTPAGPRVYIGTLSCPPALLRNIAKRAGVRVYCDTDDVILTDGQFLSITATSAGKKTLRFGASRDVTSAYDGKRVATGVDHLDLDLKLGETRTYMLR